jgi:hypothetical protein
MICFYERHRICPKFKLKIIFRAILRYIITKYVYIKNKNLTVSWYYDTILRYNTANKKLYYLVSHTPYSWVEKSDTRILACPFPCDMCPSTVSYKKGAFHRSGVEFSTKIKCVFPVLAPICISFLYFVYILIMLYMLIMLFHEKITFYVVYVKG